MLVSLNKLTASVLLAATALVAMLGNGGWHRLAGCVHEHGAGTTVQAAHKHAHACGHSHRTGTARSSFSGVRTLPGVQARTIAHDSHSCTICQFFGQAQLVSSNTADFCPAHLVQAYLILDTNGLRGEPFSFFDARGPPASS